MHVQARQRAVLVRRSAVQAQGSQSYIGKALGEGGERGGNVRQFKEFDDKIERPRTPRLKALSAGE